MARLTPIGVMVAALLRERRHAPLRDDRLCARAAGRPRLKITNGTLYHTVCALETDGAARRGRHRPRGQPPERTTYALTDAGAAPLAIGWVRRELPRDRCPPEFRIALAEAHEPRARGGGRAARHASAGNAPSSPSTRCTATERVKRATDQGASRPQVLVRDSSPPARSPTVEADAAAGSCALHDRLDPPDAADTLRGPSGRPSDRAAISLSERLHSNDRHHVHQAPRPAPRRVSPSDAAAREPLARALGARHRLLHDPRRHHDRLGREPGDQGGARPGTNNRQRHLGHERLPARLRGAAAHHRPPRRPLRPEEHLPRRPRDLHARLALVRPVELASRCSSPPAPCRVSARRS